MSGLAMQHPPSSGPPPGPQNAGDGPNGPIGGPAGLAAPNGPNGQGPEAPGGPPSQAPKGPPGPGGTAGPGGPTNGPPGPGGQRPPANSATIQKMLDENSTLIKTISDYQNMGRHHETMTYQVPITPCS